MPKSTNFQKISSDDDLSVMFDRDSVAHRKYAEHQSMIHTLTFHLNLDERQMLASKCKNIYKEYGFKPTRAQVAQMYRKYIGGKS
jgi:hypothetical protein